MSEENSQSSVMTDLKNGQKWVVLSIHKKKIKSIIRFINTGFSFTSLSINRLVSGFGLDSKIKIGQKAAFFRTSVRCLFLFVNLERFNWIRIDFFYLGEAKISINNIQKKVEFNSELSIRVRKNDRHLYQRYFNNTIHGDGFFPRNVIFCVAKQRMTSLPPIFH